MADGTALAGVIGTWVAVSLALVALFGIVTPILLMRRARDERRIALSKIDDESNEIVHPGIKIPFLPAIGRTIHVPNLRAPPKLPGLVLGRDDGPLNRKHSVTAWVMFSRTLKAYSIPQQQNGSLLTDHGLSWLPVHRLWIFAVGLLGRYGNRPDRGRVRDAPPQKELISGTSNHPTQMHCTVSLEFSTKLLLIRSSSAHMTRILEDHFNPTQFHFLSSSGCVWDVCHCMMGGVFLTSLWRSAPGEKDRIHAGTTDIQPPKNRASRQCCQRTGSNS